MELRFKIDDRIAEEIMDRIHVSNASEIGAEAISFFNWATREAELGRQIQSVDFDNSQVFIPISPSFDSARLNEGGR